MEGVDKVEGHLLGVILQHPSVLLLPGQEAAHPGPPECLHQPALAALPQLAGNVK